ncbi:hypothetical protein IKQ26_09025 [bacterium]|nr:hypothetical protein [bacterium]
MKNSSGFAFLLFTVVILSFAAFFTPYQWLPFIVMIAGIISLMVYLNIEKRENDKIAQEVYGVIKDKKEYYKVCPHCGEKLMISEENCTKCGKEQE